MSDATHLWHRLRLAGLAQGELPALSDATTPWYIRTMLGIAGWIGAIFLLGFVSVGLQPNPHFLFTGALLCAASAIIFRVRSDDFSSQFAFAVSFAGQALILLGLNDAMHGQNMRIALLMSGAETVLFLLIPNFLHRVGAALGGIIAIVFALNDAGFHAYTPALLIGGFAYLWLNEFKYPNWGSPLRALGYGLALCSIPSVFGGMRYLMAAPHASLAMTDALGTRIGAALIGAVLLWVAGKLLQREKMTFQSFPGSAVILAAVILALLSLKAPGIGLTMVILLTGFAQGNRVLAGLGGLGLLAYLSHYYYFLDISLLEKSALLTGAGITLLAARMLAQRYLPETESPHA